MRNALMPWRKKIIDLQEKIYSRKREIRYIYHNTKNSPEQKIIEDTDIHKWYIELDSIVGVINSLNAAFALDKR